MRLPKEVPLLLVIFLALGIAVLAAPADVPSEKEPSLSSHSAAPDGTLALYRWLQSLGYQVERLEHQELAPSDETSVLLVMAPIVVPDAGELKALKGWVERGGRLVLVGSTSSDPRRNTLGSIVAGRNALGILLNAFDLTQESQAEKAQEVAPTQPLLWKPSVQRVRVESDRYVEAKGAMVPLLGDPAKPSAAVLHVGNGMVYVLASSYAFSNAGLGQADNASLLLNWLPAPGAAVMVEIDEIHHGLPEDRSLARVIVHEPWGWAILYVLGVCFLYMALGGRRFGRPVRDAAEGRRAAAEYVISLAGLLRRGNKRAWVAQHYERTLRRQLALSFNIDPGLTPDEVRKRLEDLGGRSGEVNAQAIGKLLRDLSGEEGKVVDEESLVALAEETDRTIAACGGRRR